MTLGNHIARTRSTTVQYPSSLPELRFCRPSTCKESLAYIFDEFARNACRTRASAECARVFHAACKVECGPISSKTLKSWLLAELCYDVKLVTGCSGIGAHCTVHGSSCRYSVAVSLTALVELYDTSMLRLELRPYHKSCRSTSISHHLLGLQFRCGGRLLGI